MRQNEKRRKLLICMGMSLMLAGTTAGCSAEKMAWFWPPEPARELEAADGFCLPGRFAFDMVYPFHLGYKLIFFYFYYR